MKNLYLVLFLCMSCMTVYAQMNISTESFFAAKSYGFQTEEELGAVHLYFRPMYNFSILSHEIQRSSNGVDFLQIGTVSPNTNFTGEYAYTDATPRDGVNYYRIRTLAYDGTEVFSAVRKVELGKIRTEIVLYPNPVVTRQINIQLKNFAAGQYAIELFNTAGIKVYSNSFTQTEGDNSQTINLPVGVAAGIYTLNIRSRFHKIVRTVQIIR